MIPSYTACFHSPLDCNLMTPPPNTQWGWRKHLKWVQPARFSFLLIGSPVCAWWIEQEAMWSQSYGGGAHAKVEEGCSQRERESDWNAWGEAEMIHSRSNLSPCFPVPDTRLCEPFPWHICIFNQFPFSLKLVWVSSIFSAFERFQVKTISNSH